MGLLPQLDHAIFVDTGREKTKTLEYLGWLQNWATNNSSIPITVISNKNLYKDLLNHQNSKGIRFASIPAYTKNPDGTTGMLLRQCTGEYKIAQTDLFIRHLHGLKPGQRMKETVEVWKGISSDEIERLAIPQQKWKLHIYPFCDYAIPSNGQAYKLNWNSKLSRTGIIALYNHYNLPVPPKSACVFCPYQSDYSWYKMKINEPDDFQAAIAVDQSIRNSTQKGITSPVYLHESCRPLEDVQFNQQEADLWKGECSGNCHV